MKKENKGLFAFSIVLMFLLLAVGIGSVIYTVYFHMNILSMFYPFERMADSAENATAFLVGEISSIALASIALLLALITWVACGIQRIKTTFIIGFVMFLACALAGASLSYGLMGLISPELVDYGYETNQMYHMIFLVLGIGAAALTLILFIVMMIRAHLKKAIRIANKKEMEEAKTRDMIREEVKTEMDKKTGPEGTPVIVNINTGDTKKEEPKEEPVKEEAKPEPAPVKEEVKEEPKEEAKPEPKPEPEPVKEEPKPEPKEEPKKEAAPKKAPAKKAEPKKEETKPAPKKEAPKKAAPKKEEDEPKEKIYHISQHKTTNKWQVKLQGSDKAIKLFDTQAEAIEYAKGLCKTQNGSIRLHSRKGSFRSI